MKINAIYYYLYFYLKDFIIIKNCLMNKSNDLYVLINKQYFMSSKNL